MERQEKSALEVAAWMRTRPEVKEVLHPALPGAFAGTESIHRAFEAWQRGEITHSGCMVHYAVPEVDAGAVIAQTVVAFNPDDTPESYETRMHAAEHRLIVAAIQKVLALT